ncbi:MAG: winged helix-turn-helix transcriptional regulator [Anaerolineales bacterium]|uniref:helix-turn-helix transcriptional regulator n=1 Tax=Candidatus Villigracilis proximus TaxID=3140683 RepID=UPI003136DD8B|nr:winged helix-turn-helix transcriptional regulator [Anaerolineales bacterium]MBK8821929.1 winged helix-turn-helix transcriptional regulator [Anaerolineales bacterium]MBK9208619.1 winged helix-turn-helix transcriptional regulator [Anaerolineales bacterium]
MKSTRDKILQTLLQKPRSTINTLAEAVGINPISVRHHLTNLQMEGLVEGQEERHGVGRPRLVYILTDEGMERFPTRYMQLTTRLLSQIKDTMPGPVITKLFNQIAEDLAGQYSKDMQGLSMEERLDFVKAMLAREGFTVEWEKKGTQYEIHEISCPYYQIGIAHPEVCTVDQTLISKMLALPANKVQCILSGAAHCTYVIQPAEVKN